MLFLHYNIIMKKFIILLLAATVAAYLLYLSLEKRFYAALLSERPVATVRCAKAPNPQYDFSLFYFPAHPKARELFIVLECKGTDWTFEGEIVKWKRPLNVIGFQTINRPMRIYSSGGTSQSLKEGAHPLLFKAARALPVVDTSFISAVRQPFVPKVKFGIYATDTGYLLRKIK